MRLWHKDLIPYLPDLQLKGQWRECALIADALAKNGTPNHLLVNRVTEYPAEDFLVYCEHLAYAMNSRVFAVNEKIQRKIMENLLDWKQKFCFSPSLVQNARFCGVFRDWHNDEYLRICYANLFEKHNGIGKSRITDEEWQRLLDGYKAITGEDYVI